MTDRLAPITEEELHAFVDGQLPADRAEAMAAWLAAHPEDAARVTAWRAQADSIRARYGAVAEEPVPARLALERLIARERPARLWARVAAAALIAFLIGGGSGWIARGMSASPTKDFGLLTADALEAHRLYVVEVRHPVEVPGDERAHMTQWLSKRVGERLRVPDLRNIDLKLVGGRLLPGPSGATAFYMYEAPSGERFTIYCAKAETAPETALRFTEGKRFAAVYWVDDKLAYVVSGPPERARLESVAKAVYEQVDKMGSKKS
ncbi:MAG TPA: anti-sigma factor [Pseudolabrys sp.]|jgi:anti-sigma factor RsiW|nr:anti-sigma factor [Pseudolabrys sp.]